MANDMTMYMDQIFFVKWYCLCAGNEFRTTKQQATNEENPDK